MKIIHNNFIPFGRYNIVNICGILFIKGNAELTQKEYNHESIHSAQIIEMFIVGFYLWYVAEYIYYRLNGLSKLLAYHAISFEREAYENDDNLDYLKTRKKYNWI